MTASSLPVEQRPRSRWLFSPQVDLWTFLGSAVVALGLLAVGAPFGLLESDSPEWLWIGAILMIDVAHVYSTGFRVYFDRVELRRRPWLYGLTPSLLSLLESRFTRIFMSSGGCLSGVFILCVSSTDESRCICVPVNGTSDVVDTLAIYMATLYPLIHWHSHLPRNFWWFLDGDFQKLPAVFENIACPFYWCILSLYFVRSAYLGFAHGRWSPGKDIVVMTTAVCWYVGIITFNSDYAFTVTNVIIHGIPYMVLVYWYRCGGQEQPPSRHLPKIASFLGVVWMLAYLEEFLWDSGVWNERSWLFGPAWGQENYHVLLVPLLAVPQITHYVLDGFNWKRQSRSEVV